MKLIIDIPEDEYNAIKNTAFVEDEKTIFRQNANDRKCSMGLFHIVDEIKNGTPIPDNATVCDIEPIRAKIQKVLDAERDFTSENAKAQAIALSWCLEIIDKYTKGEEK